MTNPIAPNELGNIVYEQDYFSGSQALVYIGDVLVDDLIGISYQVSQRRTPIYGYASQYYKALAAGVITCGGSFWLAFKESAYLPSILKYVTSRNDPFDNYNYNSYIPSAAIRSSEGLEDEPGVAQTSSTLLQESRRFASSHEVRRANIERLIQTTDANPDAAGTELELQRMLLSLGAMNDSEFEDVAEMFEDAVWFGGGNEYTRSSIFSGNWHGGTMTDNEFLSHRRGDQYPPFDMTVSFGDMSERSANHTAIRFYDVTIMGTETERIVSTGEPIAVRYDYICRNIG